MKKFICHMVEIQNVTLTAFIGAFVIAIAASIAKKDWGSAIACFVTVLFIVGIRYYSWRKSKTESKQKVIVIKRK
jgi:hypothetical protein